MSIGVVPGYGFKIVGKPMAPVAPNQFFPPAMISKGAIKRGQELVAFWADDVEQPLKKAKLLAVSQPKQKVATC